MSTITHDDELKFVENFVIQIEMDLQDEGTRCILKKFESRVNFRATRGFYLPFASARIQIILV